MREINVGLIGFGTVGSGAAKILVENQETITRRLGMRLNLKRVADLDIQTPRPVSLDPGVLTTKAADVINDPEIDIIIQLVGGTGVARGFMLNALANGKHIVTANKALLAEHGRELFAAAAAAGREIMFEASVCGAIPVIRTLKEGLAANTINHFFGILNGTANYILSKMSAERMDFDEALARAQEKGYAEADPTFDVEGHDTAHKLALLTALAYGLQLDLADIHMEGITALEAMDIEYAQEFGYVIKLLAISRQDQGQVEARVHPAMIPTDHVLSNVGGPFNAVLFNGHASGDILLYGQGAGMMPTASAVVGDVIELARALALGAPGRVPPLAWQDMAASGLTLRPIEELRTKYYFRIMAADRPGALSKIAGVLGNQDISIKAVIQKGERISNVEPIVMLTHEAREADVKEALFRLRAMDDIVKQDIVMVRVEDRA